jgi:hypothetical protein
MNGSNLVIEDGRTFPIIMLEDANLKTIDYEALSFISGYVPWGIINHIKLSEKVGHWVACILGPDGRWYKYDDIKFPQKTCIKKPFEIGTVAAVFLRKPA